MDLIGTAATKQRLWGATAHVAQERTESKSELQHQSYTEIWQVQIPEMEMIQKKKMMTRQQRLLIVFLLFDELNNAYKMRQLSQYAKASA